MHRFWTTAVLGAALLTPAFIAPTVLRAADHDRDRVYQDRDHHDEHHWDAHEDRAYRMWVKENHRKYRSFAKLRAEDQSAYWAWRHEHSDAILHIDIR